MVFTELERDMLNRFFDLLEQEITSSGPVDFLIENSPDGRKFITEMCEADFSQITLDDFVESADSGTSVLNAFDIDVFKFLRSKIDMSLDCIEGFQEMLNMSFASKKSAIDQVTDKWRHYASYCRSCALSGESDPQTFEEFTNTIYKK